MAALIACASASASGKWTADDCMLYAVEHNFDVKSAELTHDNDRLDYRKAVGSFFPTVGASLSLQGSFGRSIDPATNTYDNLRTLSNGYSLSLSWDIFTGGQIVNQFKQAKAQKRLSESALQSRKDEIAISVLDAYVNLQYYTELLRITGLKLEESRALLVQTQRMKELGLKSAVDLSQAEAQVADDDYTHTSTQSMFINSLIKLKNTMNFPVADTLELVSPENLIYHTGGDYSAAEYGGMPDEELEALAVGALRRAVKDGDTEKSCFLAGQIAAMVKKEQPAREIIREVVEEAEPILLRASSWVE